MVGGCYEQSLLRAPRGVWQALQVGVWNAVGAWLALQGFEPIAFSGALLEIDGFTLDPRDEFGKSCVGEKALSGVKVFGQFTLCKESVNLSVANGMQISCFAAPLGFGDPVVGLGESVGDHPLAQRTHQGDFFDGERLIEPFLAPDLAQHG